MTDDHKYRGTGRTTKQMEAAPQGSVYLWVHGDVYYPKKLAEKIGRTDLKIVGPGWLENGWLGVELTGLVVDHAAQLNERQSHGLLGAITRIRPREVV